MPPKSILEKFGDIYTSETANPNYQGNTALLDSLIEHITLGGERPPALQFFRGIETGGKINEQGVPKYPEGQSHLVSGAGAKGVYQVKPFNVPTMIERGKQIGISPSFLKSLDKDPSKWTDEESDIMALVNMFPKTVPKGQTTYYNEKGRPFLVDDLMKRAFVDLDRKAMEDAYYTLWHTTSFFDYPRKNRGIPDATINRVNEMSVPELTLEEPKQERVKSKPRGGTSTRTYYQ